MVLDEAYCHYVDAADYPDSMKLLDRHPNLLVTRTFSKVYGLAALRVGFAVASAQVERSSGSPNAPERVWQRTPSQVPPTSRAQPQPGRSEGQATSAPAAAA